MLQCSDVPQQHFAWPGKGPHFPGGLTIPPHQNHHSLHCFYSIAMAKTLVLSSKFQLLTPRNIMHNEQKPAKLFGEDVKFFFSLLLKQLGSQMPNRLSRIYLAGIQSSFLYLHKIFAVLQTAKGRAVRCERNQLQSATELWCPPLCLTVKTNSKFLFESFLGGSNYTVKKWD